MADELNRAEAADALGLTPRILARMAQANRGPPYYHLSRKVILYPRDGLMRWKNDQLHMAPTDVRKAADQTGLLSGAGQEAVPAVRNVVAA